MSVMSATNSALLASSWSSLLASVSMKLLRTAETDVASLRVAASYGMPPHRPWATTTIFLKPREQHACLGCKVRGMAGGGVFCMSGPKQCAEVLMSKFARQVGGLWCDFRLWVKQAMSLLSQGCADCRWAARAGAGMHELSTC